MPKQSPFNALETTFGLLCTGPRPLAVDGRDLRPPFPPRPIPLTELGGILLDPATSYAARDRAVALLVRRARHEGGPWMVGVAGILLPGLRSALAPYSRAHPGAAADLEADALAELVQIVAASDGPEQRVGPRLVWRAAQHARRRLLRDQQAVRRRTTEALPQEPHRPWGHPDFVLFAAVAAQVISAVEADLIGETRLVGRSMVAWAAAHGQRTGTVRMRRMRAERRLVAWLADTDSEQDFIG